MIRDRIARGAAEGALAWLAYAVIETALVVFVPWASQTAAEYHQAHWALQVFIFLLYPAAGALFGALFAAVVRGPLSEAGGLFGLAACLVAYGALTGEFLAWKWPLFAMAAGTCAAIAASIRFPWWPARLRFVRSPWFVAALFAGVPFTVQELLNSLGRSERIAGTALYVVIMVGAAYAASRGRVGDDVPRTRPSLVVTLAIVTLALSFLPKSSAPGIATGVPAQGHAGKLPNIVLIVLDTVRADHLDLYGYGRKTTPNLDAAARDALVYKYAFSASDMTLPSHASLFTGVFASRHGAHFSKEFPLGRPLESSDPTLAELLKRRGYATWGVSANSYYVQREFRMDRGFTFFDDRWPVAVSVSTQGAWLRAAAVELALALLPEGEWTRVYRNAESITDEAVNLLSTAHASGVPLFFFVNYMDAHYPRTPREPFRSMFPGRDPGFTQSHYLGMKRQVVSGVRTVSVRERDHLFSQYDGGIAYIDSQLARLFGRLKELGMYDNSLVIVTSDHGEAFGERNTMEHGGVSVYNEEVRVPLVIKLPAPVRRGVQEEPVSLVDVMPTVLDVLGEDPPAGLDGRSLLAPGAPSRPIISESFRSGELVRLSARFDRDQRAVVAWPLKLVLATNGKRRIYDLAADPAETNDLRMSREDMARKMEDGLLQWLSAAAPPPPHGSRPEYSIEKLKSLGYVQ